MNIELKPLFSIITVVYNDERHIESTIKSALGQKCEDFELIIIDGKSSDRTLNIISQYQDKISKVISEPDKGVYDAMNKGVDFAQGQYIFFLNSGDLFFNNKVLEQVKQKILGLKKMMFFGDVIIADEKRGYRKKNQKNIKYENLFQENFSHQSLFINKELFRQFGLFDLNYKIFADYEWNLRVLSQGITPKYINLLISIFNIGGLSTPDTSKKKKLAYEEKYAIEKKYFSDQSSYSQYKKKSYIFSKMPTFIRNKFIYKGFSKDIKEIKT